MCRSSEWDLYWVSTTILRYPALARLDSAKSIIRYRPPNGTAGLARSAVSGISRFPSPPASTIESTLGAMSPTLTTQVVRHQPNRVLGWASCASTFSPGSIRRRCTAAPGCTWSTSPGTCAGSRRYVLNAYPTVQPDRVRIVHNGSDTEEYRPDHATDVVERIGMDLDRPSVTFVGRVTRQKGLPYLLRAARSLPPEVQLVLLAGAPDTPEIAAEVEELVAELNKGRAGVLWILKMLPKREVVQILTHSTVFVCPSVYEPMGIVNLEAMACETAVVATATGGIPEVVDDGVTGLLVPIEQVDDGTGTPVDPDRFVADLAAAVNRVLADPARAAGFGRAGRRRAVEHFSWASIADRTMEVYRSVL